MISAVGTLALRSGTTVALVVKLLFDTVRGTASQIGLARFRWKQTVEQTYLLAIESAPIIAISLLFISLMLILEFSFHMKLVLRQDSLVPAFSTMLMIRELGPVVTCLLLASRVGAAIAAQIGSMKITDQIDALRLMAIDPVDFLVVPRWIASVIACVSLTVLSIGIAILGGAFLASVKLGYNPEQFWSTMFVFTRFSDFSGGIIKAAVFGTIIPILSSHHGFRCRPGAEGVGEAATSSVVDSSVLIITADFVLTYFLYAI